MAHLITLILCSIAVATGNYANTSDLFTNVTNTMN